MSKLEAAKNSTLLEMAIVGLKEHMNRAARNVAEKIENIMSSKITLGLIAASTISLGATGIDHAVNHVDPLYQKVLFKQQVVENYGPEYWNQIKETVINADTHEWEKIKEQGIKIGDLVKLREDAQHLKSAPAPK